MTATRLRYRLIAEGGPAEEHNWRDFLGAIRRALADYPDARRAMAEEFKRLGAKLE